SSSVGCDLREVLGGGAVLRSGIQQYLEESAVIIRDVVEVGRDAHMSRSRVDDESRLGQAYDVGPWIDPRQHHDAGPLRGVRGDLGMYATTLRHGDQVLGERARCGTNRRDARRLDDVEAAKLRGNR